jgi:hypothetical protein
MMKEEQGMMVNIIAVVVASWKEWLVGYQYDMKEPGMAGPNQD